MAQLPTYPSSISFASLASVFGGPGTSISLGDYYARYSLASISQLDSVLLGSDSKLKSSGSSSWVNLTFYPDGVYAVTTSAGTTLVGTWSPLATAYYTGTIAVSAGYGGVYPGTGPVGGFGGTSSATFGGVTLTGAGGGPGQNSNTGNNYGSGNIGSYSLSTGTVLANPAGVQTVTGGAGGQDNGNYGGAGGGAPNGGTGASPNVGGYSTGGAGGYAAEWNGIRAALTIAGYNASFGNGGAGATRTTSPASAGGFGSGGGGTASISNSSPASGGGGFVLVQYVVGETTSTLFYSAGTVSNFTLPAKCSNLKIWVCGGGGGAGPSSGGLYAGGGGGGAGMAYYEWLPVTAGTVDTSAYSIKWETASVTSSGGGAGGVGVNYNVSGGFVSMATTQTIITQMPTTVAIGSVRPYYNIYIAETANTGTIVSAAHNVQLLATYT